MGLHRRARHRGLPRRGSGRPRPRRAAADGAVRGVRTDPVALRRPRAGASGSWWSSRPSAASSRLPRRRSPRSVVRRPRSTRSRCSPRSPPPCSGPPTRRCCRRCATPATSSPAPTSYAGCSTRSPPSSGRSWPPCCSRSPTSTWCSRWQPPRRCGRRHSCCACSTTPRRARRRRPARTSSGRSSRGWARSPATATWRWCSGSPPPSRFTRGALTVFSVLVSIELLGRGEPGAGTLMTAVGRRRGGAARSRPRSSWAPGAWAPGSRWGSRCGDSRSSSSASCPTTLPALVFMALIGMGNALIDVAGFTLLGRMAPDAVLARVFGVLESLVAVSIGVGALAASWIVGEWGLRPALVAVGLVCPVLAAASWWRLRALDSTVGVHDDVVGLLQRVPMLRTLPLPSVEQLARGLEVRRRPRRDGGRSSAATSATATTSSSRAGWTWSARSGSSPRSARARASARSPCCVAAPAPPPWWRRTDVRLRALGLRPLPRRRPRLHPQRPGGLPRASTSCSTATTPTVPTPDGPTSSWDRRRRRRHPRSPPQALPSVPWARMPS